MTSTPLNPDERDLLDFADAVVAGKNPQPMNDTERAYLHVQNAMQGESGAIPADLKQSTWEDVMSTLSLTPEAPVSNRTRRQQSPASPPRTPARRRMQWTPMASIAAAVLVVLASVGIWRINTMPSESLPPLAPQMAGITSGSDIALVAATPEATAVENENGSRSVPIILHVDEQPMDGPVIWLTNAGEVMYDDGTGEVQTIANGAFQVTPQTTNVIKVLTDAPEKDTENKNGTEMEGYTATYHNLITGKTLVDDGTFSSYLSDQNMFFSPLTVLTIADVPREWSIVNFETMESKSISELTGGIYPSSESISVAVSDDYSTIAIATSQYESESSSILMSQSGMPGEVAVISSDLTQASWVSVPDGMSAVGNFTLSPDGSRIAFIASDRSVNSSTMTVSVVDVATNQELTRTEQVESATFFTFQWVATGDAFVIISDSIVQSYPADGSDPTTLLETDGSIRQMPRMIDSPMIYLEVTSVPLEISTPVPATTQLMILDPASGEVIAIDGKPWSLGMSFPVTLTTNLAPIPVSQDGLTADLVHPITGEVYSDVIANVDDPMLRPDFEPVDGQGYRLLQTVTTASGVPVSVVVLADGNLAVVNTTADSFDIRIVEQPAGAAELQLNFSPGGEYLLAGSVQALEDQDVSYHLLDLTDPNSEWVQSAPGEQFWFVEIDKN